MLFKDENPKSVIKQITIFFHASFIFQIIFFIVSLYIVNRFGELSRFDEQQISIIKYLIIFLVLIIIPGGDYLTRSRIKSINPEIKVIDKIIFYRTAFFIKLALLELIDIITIIVYLLTGGRSFLLIIGILLLYFLLNSPSAKKIALLLNINPRELE